MNTTKEEIKEKLSLLLKVLRNKDAKTKATFMLGFEIGLHLGLELDEIEANKIIKILYEK